MNDVRDEAIGAVLERAAIGIESVRVEGLPEVLRRGDRRRAARFTAIGLSIAVFVGAVSWAGLELRGGGEPVDVGNRTFVTSAAPWTFEYPSGWSTKTTRETDPDHIANLLRTTIVNGPMPPEGGQYGPSAGGNEALTAELGDGGAIVIVERFWGGAASVSRDDYHPRGPGAFVEDVQSPGWTFRERSRCEGTLCFNVLEWFGPGASHADRKAAASAADSVRLGVVDRWIETDGVHSTLHDEQHNYVVTYPADWIVADENLTPWLGSPSEILSLGTFPLRVSEHPDDGFRLFDASVAPVALQDMHSNDVFISLQESTAVFAGSTEHRPDHFGPLGCDESIYGCRPSEELPEPWREAPFRAWWVPFEDSGRAFYLFVAIGSEATPEQRQQAWAVADSLAFVKE